MPVVASRLGNLLLLVLLHKNVLPEKCSSQVILDIDILILVDSDQLRPSILLRPTTNTR